MVREASAWAFTPQVAIFSPPLTLTRRRPERTPRTSAGCNRKRRPVVLSGDEGNLEDLDLDRLVTRGRPDILIGGPPCQGFSRVGRAKLDSLTDEGHAADPRNELYVGFLDAAELWRPLAVVMENVPGMLSVGGRNIADDAAADLAARGYQVGYAVLNAVWYGVPQFRERLFFIGIRDDLDVIPVMPSATHAAALPSGYLRPRCRVDGASPVHQTFGAARRDGPSGNMSATTVSEAIGDLPRLTDHLLSGSRRLGRRCRNAGLPAASRIRRFARIMRTWPGLPAPHALKDHVIRRTPRDYETFRRMKPGDRYPAALAISKRSFSRRARSACHTRRGARRRVRLSIVHSNGGSSRPTLRIYSSTSGGSSALISPRGQCRHISPKTPTRTSITIVTRPARSRFAKQLGSNRFPDAFTFNGNMGERFRQVGNAVPPLVAWAIASTLLRIAGIRGIVASLGLNPNPAQN